MLRGRAAIERTKHPPSIAAFFVLLGNAYTMVARQNDRSESMMQAVKAYRRALNLWPPIGIHARLAEALVRLTLLELRKENPKVATVWKTDGRRLGITALLHRVGSAIGAPLRHANIRAAIALKKAAIRGRPDLFGWVLGQVGGDDELRRAAEAAKSREDLRLKLEVGLRLDPNNPDAKAELKLLGS